VRIREKNNTIVQIIAVPARYQRVNVQDARLITPRPIPRGIPIISPKPTRNEGAMAISGLPASEYSIMKESSPKSRSEFRSSPLTRAGIGNINLPVVGIIANMFTHKMIRNTVTAEMINPGKKIARHLPIQTSTGLSGVASNDSILPFTFSFVPEGLPDAQIKNIRIKRGIK